jgi:hypothetical protein
VTIGFTSGALLAVFSADLLYTLVWNTYLIDQPEFLPIQDRGTLVKFKPPEVGRHKVVHHSPSSRLPSSSLFSLVVVVFIVITLVTRGSQKSSFRPSFIIKSV